MSEIFEATARLFERLPRWLMVEDLVRRRWVLELGCGDGTGSAFGADLDARQVLGLDVDADAIARGHELHAAAANLELRACAGYEQIEAPDRSFDLVVVPAGLRALGRPADVLAEVRRVLRPDGFLYVASPNPERRTLSDLLRGERPGAAELGYYDLYEALAAAFPHVKMIGQSPFLGSSLTEFAPEDPEAMGMALDDSLMEESEDATTFLALCGERPAPALDFTLVQLPYFDLMRSVEEALSRVSAREAPAAAPVHEEIVTLSVMTPAMERALALARTPGEIERLRNREKLLRRAYGRLVHDAAAARARVRRVASDSAKERARAAEAEERARDGLAEIDKVREQLKLSRLEKLGAESEHRKQLQERDDRIGELLQKVVRLTQKGRDLEAKTLEQKFAAGNAERAQAAAAQSEKRTREMEERIVALQREADGLRAALAEVRSAPRREAERDGALRERDRRIAELQAELQSMEWRVEEAVGEARRLERVLAAAHGEGRTSAA